MRRIRRKVTPSFFVKDLVGDATTSGPSSSRRAPPNRVDRRRSRWNGIVPVAEARPLSEFTGCAAFSRTSSNCYPASTSFAVDPSAGDRIDLRARVVPAHAGVVANLVRVVPPSHEWVRFARVTVNANGRMHYLWRPTTADVRGIDRDYLYQFRIPGHGRRSPVFRVAVAVGLE
jgi:hypothetical protein